MARLVTEYIGNLVADQIKVRYAEITERTFGSSNVVADAYYPTYVRKSLTQSGRTTPILGKRCSAISPFIAQELGLYQIPIEDLTKMLGYKKQDIKSILDKVKEKNLNFTLLGLGGTGMNFYHWAEELCHFTNTVNIFRKLNVIDFDYVDLTNIFRFPVILNPEDAYRNSSLDFYKIYMIPDKTILADRLRKISLKLESRHLGSLVRSDDGTIEWILGNDDIASSIIYGAPDIATREMMAKFKDLKFVSGTHGDDDCQLYIKPEQDSIMQIESYGMINLSVFFMNQIKLTISMLELLASDEDLTKTKLVMEYSFSKEYSNKRINTAGMNRTYNFPINTSNFIDQEESLPEPAAATEELSEPQAVEATEAFDAATLVEVETVRPLDVPPPPPVPPVPPVPEAAVVVQPEEPARTPVRARATRRRAAAPVEAVSEEHAAELATIEPTPIPF